MQCDIATSKQHAVRAKTFLNMYDHFISLFFARYAHLVSVRSNMNTIMQLDIENGHGNVMFTRRNWVLGNIDYVSFFYLHLFQCSFPTVTLAVLSYLYANIATIV